MLGWLRLGFFATVAMVAFWASWNWQGARWEARHNALKDAYSTAEALAVEEASQALVRAYEERLAQQSAATRAQVAMLEQQIAAKQQLEGEMADLRTRYQVAIQEPSCQEWANQPIRCNLNDN